MSEQKTKQKHTPGPWKAFTEPKFSGWWSVCDSGERELGSGDGGFEEANARLIAAAPELLEALQRIEKRIAYYASMADGDAPNIEQWAYTDQSGDMAIVRAAIAKATGQEAA